MNKHTESSEDEPTNESITESLSWQVSLRQADPFSDGPNELDIERDNKNQILQEIIMNRKETVRGQSVSSRSAASDAGRYGTPDLRERAAEQHKQPSRLVRPLIAISAAAAVLVAAVLGASLLTPQSASAQMIAAAQESTAASEGSILVTAELEAVVTDDALLDDEFDGTEKVSGTLDFDFDGDDYAFTASVDDDGEGFSPQAVFVDGDLYGSEDGQAWFSLDGEDSAEFADLATEVIPGVQNFDGSALEQLVLVTDDISKSENNGAVTYTGNVQTEKVLALDAGSLPAPLIPFRLADEGEMPLPPELRVEMTIDGDKATVVTITVEDYEVDGVIVNGTVTTDYSNVGESQNITAPPESQVQAIEELDELEAAEELTE